MLHWEKTVSTSVRPHRKRLYDRIERVIVMFESDLPQPEKHTNEELYHRQVELLKLFLEKHAITQEQFDKSYHDLTEKMHIQK